MLKILGFTVSRKKASAKPTETVGSPGTIIYNGYVQPDEKNPRLIGEQKHKTFADMLLNVAIVSAGTRYFLNLIANAKWVPVPADETPQAKVYADMVLDQMHGMNTPWTRVIRRAAMYRFHGFSVQEWTVEKVDGILAFKDISPRPQGTIIKWELDDEGEVTGIIQLNPSTSIEKLLPRWKTVYMVDDALSDSPEGMGLFRHIFSSVERLTRYEQLEGYGYESDLRGIPVGRAPLAELAELVRNKEMTAQEMEDAIKPLKAFVTNHIKNPALGILLDSMPYTAETNESENISSALQWDIDLLKGTSTSLPEIAKAIERVNRDVAMILGVEGLLVGGSNVGSHALSEDKSTNFALVVDSALQELTDTYQKDFIGRLWELNGWPDDMKPKFKTEAAKYRDVTKITAAIRDLSTAGATLAPDDPAINEVRDLVGLSPQKEIDPRDLLLDEDDDKKTDNDGEQKTDPADNAE
jgi:hypothetical protein